MDEGILVEQRWAGEVAFTLEVPAEDFTPNGLAMTMGRLMTMSAARAPAMVNVLFKRGVVEVLTRLPDGAELPTWEADTRALLEGAVSP